MRPQVKSVNMSSTITFSSDSMSSSSTAVDPIDEFDKPPCYDYDIIPPYYMVFPGEDEGDEKLPDYTCTVYKRGYVFLKQECYNDTTTDSKTKRRRPWRKVYLQLWGTLLQIDKTPFWLKKQEKDPMFIISLAGADASRALDYFKRPNAFRLTCPNKLQFLIRAPSHIDMISWIEHLQAGINISLDLETRPMPHFVTLPPHELTRNPLLDRQLLQLERAREQRRRTQHETLI